MADFRVVLEKDEDNRFVRYFIGVGASIHILLSYGLNMQSINACHSRHHIYKGPTYHFLVGRNGNNRNVTIAMTLTRSETSDSYHWMAKNLMTMRGGDGFVINAGPRDLVSLDSKFTSP